MGQLLERLPVGSRIAVIRLRSMGDCVLTTPALALLKAHRPDLEIAVVVEDRFRGVFEGNPDVSALMAPEPGTLTKWRARLALNFHGGTRSMWLTLASRAAMRVGFAHHAFSSLYNVRIPRAQQTLGEERPVHTAEHLASAMFWLGVPRTEIPRAKLFAVPPTAGKSYVVIHPFASAPDKAWAVDRFVAVASQLQQVGLEPVILAGPADDVTPFEGFRVYRNAPLAEVKSVLSGAQLFIGNDSGPAHIAAAFGIPVVVLFGASNPITWAPWRTEAQVLTSPERMSGISIEQVMAAAKTLQVKA